MLPEENDSLKHKRDDRPDVDLVDHADGTANSKQERLIRFEEAVSILFIPNREDYSSEIKESLWCSRREREMNIARNTKEFMADEFDWRKVPEEDAMYVHKGERVHPVHLRKIWAARELIQNTPSQHKDLPRPVPQRPLPRSCRILHRSAKFDPCARSSNPFLEEQDDDS